MKKRGTPIERITPELLRGAPVWEYLPESPTRDEMWVAPVQALPVKSLDGRVVGTEITLAGGETRLGLLGNVSLTEPTLNEQFLTLSVWSETGKRFDLARYHDVDYSRRGPTEFAAFLALPLASVFPIRYDISVVALGSPTCVRGQIPFEPRSKLSRTELVTLAIHGRAP